MRATFSGVLAANNDMATVNTALRFDATKGHHVDHGPFWLPGVDYSTFYWDMLVSPRMASGTGYIISAGYGGSHNLLLGTSSDAGKFSITGNIWNGVGTTSFNTGADFDLSTWHHVAVVWNGSEIITYVDGVAESSTAYVAATRSTPDNTDSVLFVGGSDHLMGTFDLAWIRGFEGTLPGIPNASYAPFKTTTFPRAAFNNATDVIIKSQFLADYTQPAGVIADLSNGLNGVNHPGVRAIGANLGGFQGSYPAVFNYTADADLPQWVRASYVPPVSTVAPTIPATALVYDSFSNRQSTPFWSNSYVLGSTEGGTLGSLAWTTGSEMYGVTSGRVFPTTTSTTEYALVETSTQTQDIRITRDGPRMMIVARYTNATNYVYALFYESVGSSFWSVNKVVGGVDTELGAGLQAGAADDDIRLVISGTSVKAYTGGVLKVDTTDGSLPSGTKAGFNLASQHLTKVSLFEVY